jgi:hypothetical protein
MAAQPIKKPPIDVASWIMLFRGMGLTCGAMARRMARSVPLAIIVFPPVSFAFGNRIVMRA